MAWHIKDFEIERVWKITKGRGVKVAILDSGLMLDHSAITRANVVATKNFIGGAADDVTDNVGHGTHCTGIVTAQSTSGVAPDVSLMIGKITDKALGLDESILFNAIEWAYKNGADVISISYTVDSFPTDFQEKIKELDNQYNGILVCSLSNVGDMGFDYDYFPAMLPEAIAVGAINQELSMDPLTARSSKIDLLAPGRDITSTWNDGGFKSKSGCSMATPFVAGVLALMIAAKRMEGKEVVKSEVKKQIIDTALSFASFNNAPKGKYPIINPLKNF